MTTALEESQWKIESLRSQLEQAQKERDRYRRAYEEECITSDKARNSIIAIEKERDEALKLNERARQRMREFDLLSSDRTTLTKSLEIAKTDFEKIKKEAGLNCYHIMGDYGAQAARALKNIEIHCGKAIAALESNPSPDAGRGEETSRPFGGLSSIQFVTPSVDGQEGKNV